MADATISELAAVVGVSVDKLLSQIKEAGLPHSKAKDAISSDDKNTLLLFLRRSHGDKEATDGAPRKITLKRKTIATLKSASTHGRGKTVSVEVRKKRTYVKRSTIVDDTPAVEEGLENLVTAKGDAETDVSTPAQDAADQAKADTTAVETEAADKAQHDATPAPAGPPPEERRAKKPGPKSKAQPTHAEPDPPPGLQSGQPYPGRPGGPVRGHGKSGPRRCSPARGKRRRPGS